MVLKFAFGVDLVLKVRFEGFPNGLGWFGLGLKGLKGLRALRALRTLTIDLAKGLKGALWGVISGV